MTHSVNPNPSPRNLNPSTPRKNSENHSKPTNVGKGILLPNASAAESSVQMPKNPVPPAAAESSLSSWWGGLTGSVAAATVNLALFFKTTKVRDEKVLRAVVPNADIIFTWIKGEPPRILGVISKLAPDISAFLSTQRETADRVIEETMIQILANLALKKVPHHLRENAMNGVVPSAFHLEPEEFIEDCMIQLVDLLGPLLEKVDEKAKDNGNFVSKELFNDTTNILIEFLFPEDSLFRSIKAKDSWLSEVIASSLASAYQPVCDWFEGVEKQAEVGPSPFADIQEDLNYYAPLFIDKIADYYINRDKAFLKMLTGNDDFHDLIKQSSSLILEQLDLKEDMLKGLGLEGQQKVLEKGIQAAALRSTYFLFQSIFSKKIQNKKTITTEEAIQKTTSFFSRKFRKTFKEIKEPVSLQPFYSNSESIIDQFFPQHNLSWLKSIINRRKEPLLKPLAELQASIYNEISGYQGSVDVKESYDQRLRNVLWNPLAVKDMGVYPPGKVPNVPDLNDSKLVGLEPQIDQFYNLCMNAVGLVGDKFIGFFATPGMISYLIKGFKYGEALDENVIDRLSGGIESILGNEDKESDWVSGQIRHITGKMLYKVLVNFVEKVPMADRHPPEKLFFKALELFLDLNIDKLSGVQEKIALHKTEGLSDEELEAFRTEAVKPAVDSWIEFFSLNEILPLPKTMHAKLIKVISENGSKHFGDIFSTVTSWIADRKVTETTLNSLFPPKLDSNEPCSFLKVSRVIPYAATQAIPFVLRTNNEKILETISPFFNAFFSKDMQSPDDPQTHEQAFQMIAGILSGMADGDSVYINKLFNFAGEFGETVLVRLVTELFKFIRDMELEGLDTFAELDGLPIIDLKVLSDEDRKRVVSGTILEYLLEKVLVQLGQHFNGISATKTEHAVSKPTREQFIETFEEEGILHPALKNEALKKTFLDDLTAKLFKIIKIKEKQFPIPKFALDYVFDLIKMAIPEGLEFVCTTIANPGTINQVLISSLNQAVNENEPSIVDKLFSETPAESTLEAKFTDNYQIKLEKALVDVLVALVGMQPDRMPKYLIQNEDLQKFAAEAVGQSLREVFTSKQGQRISLLTMLDNALSSASDSFAPSVWNETIEQFEYLKTTFEGVVEVDSTTEEFLISETPNLSRFFPKTEEEAIQCKDFNKKVKRKAEKNVPKFLRNIINHQTDQIAVEAFIEAWKSFEEKFEEWLISSLGEEYGKKAFDVLLPITHYLIKYPLAVGVLIFNYTVWVIASQILKLIFNKQAKKRVRDVDAEIHDNAIYRGMELFINRYDEQLSSNPVAMESIDDDFSDELSGSDSSDTGIEVGTLLDSDEEDSNAFSEREE